MVFKLGEFFAGLFVASREVATDRRTLVLRTLETVEDIDAHPYLTEVLVRELAQIEREEDEVRALEEDERSRPIEATGG